MIRFSCACGRSLKAPEKLAGKKSRCPACALAVVVPQMALVFAGHESSEESPPEETFAKPTTSTWVPCPEDQGDPNYVPTILRMRDSGARPDPLLGMKFV